MNRQIIEAALRSLPCIVCLGDERKQSKELGKNTVGAIKCVCEGNVEKPGTMMAAWTGAKVHMLQAAIEKTRAASPDGMTSWDRVEKFRQEHGHLPGDLEAEARCPLCKK